jgi:hypothetical protein
MEQPKDRFGFRIINRPVIQWLAAGYWGGNRGKCWIPYKPVQCELDIVTGKNPNFDSKSKCLWFSASEE